MRRLGLLVIGLSMVTAACASRPPAPRSARPLSPPPAPVNVTGKWTGTWTGFGIQDIPRSALATAQFTQTGRNGYGRLVLDDTAAAEALPLTIRWAGLAGVPVLLEVSGSKLTVRHELGDEVAAFTVSGDQMVGRISNVDVPIRIKLTREP